jgi:hypothetical protein
MEILKRSVEEISAGVIPERGSTGCWEVVKLLWFRGKRVVSGGEG